jgi:Ca2+-transporting ATPase
MREAVRRDAVTNWHGLPVSVVLERLGTTPSGLDDAEARARLIRYGPNELTATPPVSVWRILAGQLKSVVVLLLVVAAAVALVRGDLADGVAIAVVLLLNVALGLSTEVRARRAMEALLGLQVARASVVREGHPHIIDARELVPGDIIEVEAGQAVPADARLIHGAELRTTESALTGESVAVEKRADTVLEDDVPLPDRRNMLYQATSVAAGSGRAAIVATGMATEVGRLGALVAGIAEAPTVLERRLDVLGRRLAGFALVVGVLVAVLSLLQGTPLGEVVQTGIAVAIAAVPEGLPAVITITMAVGVRRMARRHALVRRLPAVESLGSATIICTDKTGTLTAGEMTVTTLWVAGRELRVTGAGYSPEGEFFDGERSVDPRDDPVLALALQTGALVNRAHIARGADVVEATGDPTETALLVAASKGGIDRTALLAEWPEVAELPFSSERRLMATFHRSAAGQLIAFAKGAPGRIVELSDRVVTRSGEQALDSAGRAALLKCNEALAARGLRVLALAYGPVTGTSESALRDLAFVGLVGMMDPPAAGVEETIHRLRDAGVRTVMLTGDQRLTADAVARALGVLAPGEETTDGRTVERSSDEELEARIERFGAFSRVSPEAKLRIVSAFQRRGEIVAMIGDGVNDAAALKKADIGIAMGRRGTDVAKEAAGVVLADDRFQTIAAAVEEGRVIFDNIRKFVFYLFGCNLAEILVLLGAGLAGLPLPLFPLQILWLNLLTDTFPALALAAEPAEPDIMRRPPRNPRSTILSRGMLAATAGHATLISAVTLAAFVWGLRAWPAEPRRAMTLAFMTLAFAQIFHLANARSEAPLGVRDLIFGNRLALGAAVLAVVLQLLAVYAAPLARVLDVTPPTAEAWAVVVGLALFPAVVGVSVRRIRLHRASVPMRDR